MLKFELLQVQDLKEAAAIERRRRYEDERKKRIFNARNRIIGVDYDALDRQIQEKREREAEEKKLEQLYIEKQRNNAKIALALEVKEKQERKKISEEINRFRNNYQKPEDRREYDLNDPKYLLKSLPMRLNDDDPRCGISSIQKFEGEDLSSDVRKKLQLEQTKAWLEQQIKEQRQAEKDRKDAEDAYQAAVVARDERALELDRLERECKTKLQEAICSFNQSLSQQQNAERDIKHRQELEDNFAEMYNAVTGDFLTENPTTAQSNLGLARNIPYMYKGMSPAERDAIRQEQLRQIEENKKKRNEAARLEKYWDDYLSKNGITMASMDSEMQIKQRELKKHLAEYNKTLGEEQKAYKEYLDRVVYTNRPTASYFDQFNTSTR